MPGIRVGHFTDSRRPTGCTAILFDSAAAAGIDYDGSAPGESQAVLLQPVSPVERIHGIFLTGGGVLALPSAGGVLRFLEERKVGFDWGTPDLRIPIVVSAVIDDLAVGDPHIRVDDQSAYKACAAATAGPVAEGNVGAGAGATLGKMHRGRGLGGMKGGLGTASLKLGDVVLGALAVVNAAGDVLDWRTGRIIAGARRSDGRFADSVDVMRAIVSGTPGAALDDAALRSTTLAVVATNVDLSKTSLTKLAMMANCGAGARNPAVSHDRRRRSALRGLDSEAAATGPRHHTPRSTGRGSRRRCDRARRPGRREHRRLARRSRLVNRQEVSRV